MIKTSNINLTSRENWIVGLLQAHTLWVKEISNKNSTIWNYVSPPELVLSLKEPNWNLTTNFPLEKGLNMALYDLQYPMLGTLVILNWYILTEVEFNFDLFNFVPSMDQNINWGTALIYKRKTSKKTSICCSVRESK